MRTAPGRSPGPTGPKGDHASGADHELFRKEPTIMAAEPPGLRCKTIPEGIGLTRLSRVRVDRRGPQMIRLSQIRVDHRGPNREGEKRGSYRGPTSKPGKKWF